MIERYMLNEELEKDIVNITGVDYTSMLKLEDIQNMLKDLICAYHNLEEEYEDAKEHCIQCHVEKKIDPYDEYGINEKDFH